MYFFLLRFSTFKEIAVACGPVLPCVFCYYSVYCCISPALAPTLPVKNVNAITVKKENDCFPLLKVNGF